MAKTDGADDLEQVVAELLGNLEETQNTSDSEGFAASFHPEADFVDVLGRITRGRDAIGRLHRMNFASIHVGSRIKLEPLAAKRLGENVALVHVQGSIQVPAGPLAGDSLATQTMVLERSHEAWQIRAFHNTFVRDMPGIPAVEGVSAG